MKKVTLPACALKSEAALKAPQRGARRERREAESAGRRSARRLLRVLLYSHARSQYRSSSLSVLRLAGSPRRHRALLRPPRRPRRARPLRARPRPRRARRSRARAGARGTSTSPRAGVVRREDAAPGVLAAGSSHRAPTPASRRRPRGSRSTRGRVARTRARASRRARSSPRARAPRDRTWAPEAPGHEAGSTRRPREREYDWSWHDEEVAGPRRARGRKRRGQDIGFSKILSKVHVKPLV